MMIKYDDICYCLLLLIVKDIGEALRNHFPYDRSSDKNELPDEIIFGK